MSETPIELPYPTDVGRPTDSERPVDAERLDLRVKVGACRFRLVPGDDTAWLRGTYRDPSDRIGVHLEVAGKVATLRQAGTPGDWVGVFSGVPTLDLAVGTARPTTLRIDAGASDVDLEVGGVPLTGLTVRTGAGRCRLSVSRPNPVDLDELVLAIGAGATDGTGLANANAAELLVEGGASDCSLRFDGAPLRRDMKVRVTSGMSSVDVFVPPALPVEVRADATLGRRQLPEPYVGDGDRWTNAAARAGDAPRLRLHASVTLGTFRVRELPA